MKFALILHVLISLIVTLKTATIHDAHCDNENRLLVLGNINNNLADNITLMHNQYRLMIAQGIVPTQPQGVNLRRLYYDRSLADMARVVSLGCEMKRIKMEDPRWYNVGQNSYLEYSNVMSVTQNWEAAIESWFNEQVNYKFPENKGKLQEARATEHFTQLVWAESYNVGCDFVLFYDTRLKRTPYGKLYTCFYGPGGNIPGRLPYDTGSFNDCYYLC